MHIYLIDWKERKCDFFRKYFRNEANVEIVCDDFRHFMQTHADIECVVSPANAYGLMDGGYDLAITQYFGTDLMKRAQQYILDHFHGEQPVGTSFIMETNFPGIKLIHTPTMRVPSEIKEPMVVYQAMRTTLLCASENDVKSILIPAFGGECGMMHMDLLAKLMYEGYKQVFEAKPKEITWEYADRIKPEDSYWRECHNWPENR